MDIISFEEFTLAPHCDITAEAIKHTAQAGAVFGRRAETLKTLEIAKDNVKSVLADLEMEVHSLGYIPLTDEDGELKKGKITGQAVKAYCDAHDLTKKAREDRAQAEYDHDLARAVVTAYITKKELLQIMMSDRKNEFYSTPTENAVDAMGNKIK